MATYLELHQLISDNNLRNRISTAVVVSATAYLTNGASTAAQKKWALSVMQDPIGWGQKAMAAALAINKASTTSQITSATDSALQTAIDSVAAAFADAL